MGFRKMEKEDKIIVLQMINEWIKFADAKAGIIFATNGVILTILFSQGESPSCVSTLCASAYNLGLIGILISLIIAVKIVLPNLKTGSQQSNIFFWQIARFKSGSEYEAAISSEHYIVAQDITNQIWINSKIASKKYCFTYWSIIFGSIGLSLIVISYFF